MALPVDVRSIDVLAAVREALVLFVEDAKSAMGSMDGEIRRCVDWLTHDQRIHWQAEIKRRDAELAAAKAELNRKQLSQAHGGQVHDSDQRENVRTAKRRLAEAEEKLEEVKRWLPVVQRAVMGYHGQARPFADLVEFDVGRSVELVDRMIAALEDYMRDDPPRTAPPIASTASASASVPAPSPLVAPVAAPEPISTEEEEAP